MKTTGGKPRNWVATNLRHHKPRRIEDKREALNVEAMLADFREFFEANPGYPEISGPGANDAIAKWKAEQGDD